MTPTKLLPQWTRRPSSEAFRRWLERAAPLLVVLLAATLRLYRIDYAQYRGDDEMIVSLAFRLLHFGELPLRGVISSLGVNNGSVSVYLLALPLALGANEVGVTAFIAALNTLTVALTYLFVRSFFGRRTALITTLLFAVNPWAVVYGRRSWLNADIPFFTLLLMWNLFRACRLEQPIGAPSRVSPAVMEMVPGGMLGLSLSAIAQVHLSGMVHLVTAGIAVVAGRMWRAPRMLLTAVVTFAATFAPYLLTAVVPGLSRVLASRPAGEGVSGWLIGSGPLIDWGRIKPFFYLLTHRGYQSYATQGGRMLDTTQGFFVLIDMLMLLAFALGALVALQRIVQRRESGWVGYLLLLVWIALPLLFLAPPIKSGSFVMVYPFYYLVTLPGPFILVALGLEAGAAKIQSVIARLWPVAVSASTVGGITYAIVSLIVSTQLVAAAVFFTVLHEYWLKADYGLPLSHTLAVVGLTLQQAGTEPIWVGGHGDAANVLYRVLQRRRVDVRFFEDRNLLPALPDAGSVWYLTTDETAWATHFLLDHFAPYEQSRYRIPGEGWTARLFKLQADELLAAAALPAEPGPLGRILDLAEVQATDMPGVAQTGGAIEVKVQWRFLREPDRPYITRLFLQDTHGEAGFIHEEVAYPAKYWRTGDSAALIFLNRFRVPIPWDIQPGEYNLTLNLEPLSDGQPMGEPVVLGRLRIDIGTQGRAPSH